MKKLIGIVVAVMALTFMASTATANAAVFKTEAQAEQYLWDEYADWYADDGYTMDDASCDGYGRWRDGGDGADDRYTKFECQVRLCAGEDDGYYDDEYWDYDDDEYSGSGFTDTDILKARSWGFKIRNIDSYDW